MYNPMTCAADSCHSTAQRAAPPYCREHMHFSWCCGHRYSPHCFVVCVLMVGIKRDSSSTSSTLRLAGTDVTRAAKAPQSCKAPAQFVHPQNHTLPVLRRTLLYYIHICTRTAATRKALMWAIRWPGPRVSRPAEPKVCSLKAKGTHPKAELWVVEQVCTTGMLWGSKVLGA